MQRTIRSFVLRGGRITPRQQAGLDLWLKQYRLPTESIWDLELIFGRQAETIVEIGFGMGSSLLAMAQQNPEINYIGIEVHRAGVGSLSADLYEHQINNVRIANLDATEVFKTHLPDHSLSGVQVFFPDPWPKKKHHKRRLIQPDFIRLLIKKIKSGGFIHCATDWQGYAEHMLEVLKAEPDLVNVSKEGSYILRPPNRPLTKFEQRGKRLGHDVWDLLFKLC